MGLPNGASWDVFAMRTIRLDSPLGAIFVPPFPLARQPSGNIPGRFSLKSLRCPRSKGVKRKHRRESGPWDRPWLCRETPPLIDGEVQLEENRFDSELI